MTRADGRVPESSELEPTGSFLYRVFRGTEELNRKAILSEIAGLQADRILDCGCGDGSFTRQLADHSRAREVYGIEIDSDRVHDSRSRGIHAVQSDLNGGLPFQDESFDVVHSNQVIEHVVDTDGFLREMKRVVRKKGTVLLSTNNMASWHNVLSLALGYQPPPQHASREVIVGNPLDPLVGSPHPTVGDSHLRIFSYRGLRDVCEYHGFEIRRFFTVGYYPFPPRLAKYLSAIDRRHGAFLVASLVKP